MEPTIIEGVKYYWCEFSLDDLDEFLGIGHEFAFRYQNANYNVQGAAFDNDEKGRVGFYYIWNEDGDLPESMQAKNPDEFKALKFIEGKTILEVFDELRFFNS